MSSRTSEGAVALFADRPASRYQIKIIAFCVLIAFWDGYDALNIGYVIPSLSADWGVTPALLTPVLTAGTIGTIVGAITLGSFADSRGRRPVIIGGVAIFAIFSGAMALAPNVPVLTVTRFLAGIGLGAVLPTLVALGVEFSPAKKRMTTGVILGAAVAAGGFVGGGIVNFLLPLFGWQSVFVVGAVLPMILVPFMVKFLPESLAFLESRHREADVRKILAKIDPDLANAPLQPVAAGRTEGKAKAPLRILFQDGRASTTVLLWTACFCGYMLVFVMASWMPTLLVGTGMAQPLAVWATSLLTLGNMIGGVVLGLLVDRRQDFRVLLLGYPLGAVAIIGIVLSTPLPAVTLPFALLLGLTALGVVGAQTALAATIYPSAARATGVSWALTSGRIASVLGPLLVGIFIAMKFAPKDIFLLGLVPAVLGAIAMLGLVMRLRKTDGQSPAEEVPTPLVAEPEKA
jgi:MFS transporter, AAHS family, 4-hydroxybenzoate transporter